MHKLPFYESDDLKIAISFYLTKISLLTKKKKNNYIFSPKCLLAKNKSYKFRY